MEHINKRFSLSDASNSYRQGMITAKENEHYKLTFDTGGIEFYKIIEPGNENEIDSQQKLPSATTQQLNETPKPKPNDESTINDDNEKKKDTALTELTLVPNPTLQTTTLTTKTTFAIEKETSLKVQILLGDDVKHTPKSYSVYITPTSTPSTGHPNYSRIICKILGEKTPNHQEFWSWHERGFTGREQFLQTLQYGLYGKSRIQILKRGTKIEAESVAARLREAISTLTVAAIEEPVGYPYSSLIAQATGDALLLIENESNNNNNNTNTNNQRTRIISTNESSSSNTQRTQISSISDSSSNPGNSARFEGFEGSDDETPVQMINRLRTRAENGDEEAQDRLISLREHVTRDLNNAIASGDHSNINAMRSLIDMCRFTTTTSATSTSASPSSTTTTSSTLRQTSFSDFVDVLEDVSPELTHWFRNPPTGKLPTSQETVEYMKKHCGKCVETQDEADGLELCCVCMSGFSVNDIATKLPKCGHVFHLEAAGDCLGLNEWLKKHDTCPICRQEITIDSKNDSTSSAPSRKRMAQARALQPLDDEGSWVCGGCYSEVPGNNDPHQRCQSCQGTNDASKQAFKLEIGFFRKVIVCARLLEELEDMRCPKAHEKAALKAAHEERARLLNSSLLKSAIRSNWQIRGAVKKMLNKRGKMLKFSDSFYMQHDPNTRVVLHRLWEMWSSVVDMKITGINKDQWRHFPATGIPSHEFGQMQLWSAINVVKDMKKRNAKIKNKSYQLDEVELNILEETILKLKSSGFTWKSVGYDERVFKILEEKVLHWPEKRLGGILDLTRMLVLTEQCQLRWGAKNPSENSRTTATDDWNIPICFEQIQTTSISCLKSDKKLPTIMSLRLFTNALRLEPTARSFSSYFNAIATEVEHVVMSENGTNQMVYEGVQFLIRNVASTFSQGFVPLHQKTSIAIWIKSLLSYYNGSLKLQMNDITGIDDFNNPDQIVKRVFADFVAIGTLLSSLEDMNTYIVDSVRTVVLSMSKWVTGLKGKTTASQVLLCECLDDIESKCNLVVKKAVVSNTGNDAVLYENDSDSDSDED